jgi:hypothetical protein
MLPPVAEAGGYFRLSRAVSGASKVAMIVMIDSAMM